MNKDTPDLSVPGGILMNDGSIIPVDYLDLMALVEAGLVRVTGLDKKGRPCQFTLTQDAFDYAKQLENEDK